MVALHSHYFSEGLEILAFPCNQFGQQEPGTAREIKDFVKARGVEFKMMKKVMVNGAEASDVFKFLKQATGETITWNFSSYFLVSRDGQVQGFHGRNPMELEPVLRALLGLPNSEL